MTTEQFNAILFRFISHTCYDDEHISVYKSTNFAPTITVKVFTKMKNMFETGKPRLHTRIPTPFRRGSMSIHGQGVSKQGEIMQGD